MNRTYRTVWHDRADTAVLGAKLKLSLAVIIAQAFSSTALALPTGAAVVAGSASVVTVPGAMTVNQTTARAILNWQGFNIAAGESVNFVQPDRSAIALNRVLGSDPAAIFGTLTANGSVFLVNPQGVLFGKGAAVNVGGLVASTLDLGNDDFMTGQLRFGGTGRAVVRNEGALRADGGYVALLGTTVENSGSIDAPRGSVVLAGGQGIKLDLLGGLLQAKVEEGAVNAAVSNAGVIHAPGGQVLLTTQAAGKLLDTVVNNSGVIEAQTLDRQSGRILLLGDMQSGTATVSGTLDASAPRGGDGGFVETSAASVKVADGTRVTTLAAAGQTGTWLVDPRDYVVASSGGDITGTVVGSNLATTNQILAADGSVLINDAIAWSSNNSLTLRATRDVAVNAAITAVGTTPLVAIEPASAIPGTAVPDGQFRLGPAGLINLPNVSSNNAIHVALRIAGQDFRVVNNQSDLQGMAAGANVALGSDITLAGNFTPAAGMSQTFDGLGHKLTGLTIAGAANGVGLFKQIDATGTVRNLKLVNPAVAGGTFTQVGTVAGTNRGHVENVLAYADGGTATVSGAAAAGGLVGENFGTIARSGAEVAVSGAGTRVGGLVGHMRGGSIDQSYASGNVSSSAEAGGLIGLMDSVVGLRVERSYATGNVTAGDVYGGLVGKAHLGSFSEVYASGELLSTGGRRGGLIGIVQYGVDVSAAAWKNGYSTAPAVPFGLWGTSNQTAPDIPGSSASALMTATPYAGFDLNSAWKLYAGHATPLLRTFLKPVTVTLAAPGAVSYNGQDWQPASNATCSVGVCPSEVNNLGAAVVAGAAAALPRNSGVYQVRSDAWSTQRGYLIAAPTQTLTIDPKIVTATATAANKVYDGNTDATVTGTSLSGLIGTETLSLTTGAASFNSKDVATANTVTVNSLQLLQGANDTGLLGNYQLGSTTTTASANITPATVTAVVTAANKVYDGNTNAAVTGTSLSGLIGTETLSFSTGAASFNSKDVATANTVTVNSLQLLQGANDTGLVGNYQLGSTTTTASATITPATVIAAATAANKVYDGNTNATVTGTSLSGLIGTETLSLSTGAASFNSKDVATANTVTVNSLQLLQGANDTGLVGNYQLGSTTTTAPATITPATVIAAATAANKVYDGNTDATVTGTSLSGLIGTETLSLTTGAASFNSKDVATANTVTVNSLQLLQGANDTGLLGNYQLGSTTATASATITPATVIAAATASNKVYDGNTNTTVTGTSLSGLIGTETLSLTTGAASFNSKDVATANTVTVNSLQLLQGANDTGLVGNYQLASTTTTASASIRPATLTVTATAANKVYDGNTDATVTGKVLAGLIGTETLSVSHDPASFNAKDVVAANTVTVSNLQLLQSANDTGLVSNYQLGSTTTTAPANITARPLQVTPAARNKVYDGLTAAPIDTTAVGYVNDERLTLTPTASFADVHAATGKSVTLTGIQTADGANGGLASNYDLQITGAAPLVADITPRPINAIASAADKIYDGLNHASVTLDLGSGLVGNETLGQEVAARFVDRNAVPGQRVLLESAALLDGDNGGRASNYALTVSNRDQLNASVLKRPLTATLMAEDKFYDGTVIAGATLALQNLVPGESLGSSVGGVFDSAGVGTNKMVTIGSRPTLQNGPNGAQASNYTIASLTPAAFATIHPADLIITADSAAKTYGTTFVPTGYSAQGLATGETVGAVTLMSDGSVPTATVSGGPYAIVPSAASGGSFDPGNYRITYQNGVLDVSRAALTVTPNAAVRTYGAANPPLTLKVEGFVNGETDSVLQQRPLVFTTATGSSASGTYQTFPIGGAADNYDFDFRLGALTIAPAPLTVQVLPTFMPVGGPLPTPRVLVTGFQNGETLATATEGNWQFQTSATAASPPGRYGLTAVGVTALHNNYTLTQSAANDGALLVVPRFTPTSPAVAARFSSVRGVVDQLSAVSVAPGTTVGPLLPGLSISAGGINAGGLE